MTDQLTSKAQAEQLIKEMLRGKEVHKFFTDSMKNNVLISGQPIEHWETEFRLRIKTEDLDPESCRRLDLQVMQKNEDATFFYNMAMARAQLIKNGNASVFMGKFQALVEEYKGKQKRLPAKDTLENLARADQLDVESAQAIAEIEVKFWKNILDHLGRCQSILKNASMMISTEMKHLTTERQMDAMERSIQHT